MRARLKLDMLHVIGTYAQWDSREIDRREHWLYGDLYAWPCVRHLIFTPNRRRTVECEFMARSRVDAHVHGF